MTSSDSSFRSSALWRVFSWFYSLDRRLEKYIRKIEGGSGGKDARLGGILGWRMTGSAVTRWTFHSSAKAYVLGREFEGGGAKDSVGAEAGGFPPGAA